MWVEGCRNFPHANQETNNSVEAYHYFLKSKFLSDRRKKCGHRMDWLLYQLLKNVEPYYRFRDILQEGGYLNNYRKEKQFESSIERAKRIPDTDCWAHENISHAYWVRSQTNRDNKYLVTWFHMDFIVCECPWFVRGNTCKHIIKINWLYFSSGGLDAPLEHDIEPLTFDDGGGSTSNAPIEVNMGMENIIDSVNTTDMGIEMANENVDQDIEAFRLVNEEYNGYVDMLQNNCPPTLSDAQKMVGLLKKLLEEANNQLMDFEFPLGPNASETSLKWKKSFLSPKNKRRRRQNSGMEIDLNVHPPEFEPFQFASLNRRGRPRSNNASPIVSSKLDWLNILLYLGYFM